MEVDAQILEAILRFESTEDTGAALDASLLLKSSDPAAASKYSSIIDGVALVSFAAEPARQRNSRPRGSRDCPHHR